jgi:outer membrane protein assembly factor BamB
MRNRGSLLKVVIVIGLALFLLKDCVTQFLDREAFRYDPLTVHQVIETSGLITVWVQEEVFIQSSDLHPMIVASQGLVSFLGGLGDEDKSTVTVLDAEDGELQWQIEYGSPDAIFVSPSALYIGQGGGVKIIKYDAFTRDTKWQTSLPGTRGLVYLSVVDDEIYIQTSASTDKFFVLDANSGQIIRQLNGTAIFLSTKEATFRRSIISNEFETLETSTQTLLWNTKLNTRFIMLPVFTDNEVLIRTDNGEIYCLERKTGIVRWKTENIAISNPVLAQHLVYFLDREGKLQGIDLQSGEMKHFVQFDTERFVLNGEAHIGSYYVAYDPQTEMIFTQLGDSAQLFAFKLADK